MCGLLEIKEKKKILDSSQIQAGHQLMLIGQLITSVAKESNECNHLVYKRLLTIYKNVDEQYKDQLNCDILLKVINKFLKYTF